MTSLVDCSQSTPGFLEGPIPHGIHYSVVVLVGIGHLLLLTGEVLNAQLQSPITMGEKITYWKTRSYKSPL